jgi:hypothetical protein
MVEDKGYFIFGKALKVYPDSAYWWSQGDIFINDAAGSILIARLGDTVSEQAARKIWPGTLSRMDQPNASQRKLQA